MWREGGSEGGEEEEGVECNIQPDRDKEIMNGKRKDVYDGAFSCVCSWAVFV
jgi:hypothetical protein